MKQESSCQSGSRHTRSQIGPDWTLKNALILVNEIVAVEGDCQKALSSIQKWKIIADNCTVLDVPRTSNQCRRKWDSLLVEYNKIKRWETQSRNKSFWSLGSERREEFGLPIFFDGELFKAIDDHVMTHDIQSDTEPDSDPEAEADMVTVIEEIGPKKQKRRLIPPKSHREGKLAKFNSSDRDEKPPQSHPETKSPVSDCEGKPQEGRAEENPQEEVLQKRCSEANHPPGKVASLKAKEQKMMSKLRENAELIHIILNGKTNENHDYNAFGSSSPQVDSIRRKGDALITYLGEIVNTLHQLHVNARDSN